MNLGHTSTTNPLFEVDRVICERTEVVGGPCVLEPVVSVCMLTFNHKEYVGEAMASVLAQRTQFSFELVVGDDCSDDGTRDIVLACYKEHKDKMRVLLSTENLGKYTGSGRINFIRNLKACKGKYVALLEGDDYWSDPLKLQKQVDVMEADAESLICFHSVVEKRTAQDAIYRPAVIKERYTADDLFEENFMRTCSVMYRNVLSGELPPWFGDMPMGDWPLHLLHAVKGGIRYIDEPMACYRVHDAGIWSSSGYVRNVQKSIEASMIFMQVFPREQHKNIPLDTILRNQREIVSYCLVYGRDPFKGRLVVFQILVSGHLPVTSWGAFLRLLFWCFCPWVKWLRGSAAFKVLSRIGVRIRVPGA